MSAIESLAIDFISKRIRSKELRAKRNKIIEEHEGCMYKSEGMRCFEKWNTPPEYEKWCECCSLATVATREYQQASRLANAALGKLRSACVKRETNQPTPGEEGIGT